MPLHQWLPHTAGLQAYNPVTAAGPSRNYTVFRLPETLTTIIFCVFLQHSPQGVKPEITVVISTWRGVFLTAFQAGYMMSPAICL